MNSTINTTQQANMKFNRLYDLPTDIQLKIFEYDDTYKEKYNEVIKQIKAKELSRIYRKCIVNWLPIEHKRIQFIEINGKVVETYYEPFNHTNPWIKLTNEILISVHQFNRAKKRGGVVYFGEYLD